MVGQGTVGETERVEALGTHTTTGQDTSVVPEVRTVQRGEKYEEVCV